MFKEDFSIKEPILHPEDVNRSIISFFKRFGVYPGHLSKEAQNWLKEYVEYVLRFRLAVLREDNDSENIYNKLIEEKLTNPNPEVGQERILIELNKILLKIPEVVIEQYLEDPENFNKLFLKNP